MSFTDVDLEGLPLRDVDILAQTLYEVRSISPRSMTPERWHRIKEAFPTTVEVLYEEAVAMIVNGELDD